MKKITATLLTTAVSLLFFVQTKGQDKPRIPLINSGELIEEGVALHDEEKYSEAIEKFLSVPKNDTNYAYALSELSLSYVANGDSIKAIETCKKGIALNSEYTQGFYVTLGDAYDMADSLDKAVQAYSEGLKKFPYWYKYWYEMGIAYASHENDSAALRCFQNSIRLHPLHAGSHYQIANLAARNNKFTQALLSYEFFLLIENTSKRSLNALMVVQSIAKGEFVVDPDSTIDISHGNDHFEEIEELIRSKAALSDKYKTDVKLPYMMLVKTLQAMNEKLTYNAGDKGFWMQTYVPLLTEMWKNDFFPAMMYHSFASVEDDAAQKAFKSNKAKIEKMLNFGSSYVSHKMVRDKFMVNGKQYSGFSRYYENSRIKSIGDVDEKTSASIGDWVYFWSSGTIKSQGSYDNAGNAIGEWKYYYPEGPLKKILHFEKGVITGPYEAYYVNGSLKEKGKYDNELYDGPIEYYYSTGVLNAIVNYSKGKTEGSVKVYHENGKLKRESTNKNDMTEGVYKEYHPNGQLSVSSSYVMGKENGEQKTFNEDGKIISKVKITNDQYDSELITYFPVGSVEKSGVSVKGKETGLWKEYYDNGKIYSETNFSNGVANGIQKVYDRDGIQYAEVQYSNGNIKKYKYMDKSGKVVSQGEEKGNKIDFVQYWPDGTTKMSECKYVNGLREGLFISYYRSGKKSRETNYEKGVKQGEQISYFQNGKLKQKISFTDNMANSYTAIYYINGQIEKEGWYVDDELQGTWREYHPDGSLRSENYYLNGDFLGSQFDYDELGRLQFENTYDERELLVDVICYDTSNHVLNKCTLVRGSGEYKTLHLNKAVSQQATYKNDGREGEVKIFFPNGSKSALINYKDGKRNGLDTRYYYNGKIKSEYFYKDGDVDSVSRNYYDTGIMMSGSNYKRGNIEGVNFYNYETGKKYRDGNYHDDDKDGYFTYYANDGVTVRFRLFYDRGMLISYSYLGKDNKFVDEIVFKNGTGNLVAYFPNGVKSAEISFQDGYYEGKRIFYYMNGKTESDDLFKSNDQEGVSIEYHENGMKSLEENYFADEKNGVCKYYNQKGILIKEATYRNGSLEGTLAIYDDLTGKLKKKIKYVDDMPYE